ncbi:hypothetical protein UlMin_008443 [Ulmus minor]
MMEAGVRFGQGTRKWNPRIAPYISAKQACDLVFDATSRVKQFLIVDTKNKAIDSIVRAAIEAQCHYVNKKKWLGNEKKKGKLNYFLKSDVAIVKRKLSHLQTHMGRIKYMTRLLDIVIIVDQQEEYTAL